MTSEEIKYVKPGDFVSVNKQDGEKCFKVLELCGDMLRILKGTDDDAIYKKDVVEVFPMPLTVLEGVVNNMKVKVGDYIKTTDGIFQVIELDVVYSPITLAQKIAPLVATENGQRKIADETITDVYPM